MSNLLVPFLYELRKRKLAVGTLEVVRLAHGLSLGLHDNSLSGFYYLARAVLVHREADLDGFDRAFFEHFRGAETTGDAWLTELAESLPDDAALARVASGSVDDLSLDALRELFGRVLTEEAASEAGGATLAEGQGLFGQRLSKTAARGAGVLGMADARRYRRYRSDVVLDVRQIEVALRRLRSMSRQGQEVELDVDATVDQTARAFGDLEIVLRPPKRSNVKVLLLMDVGGSMEPFARTCSQLFSAAKRASNLRELKTYYFHNVPYGRVFSTDGLMEPVEIPELLHLVNQRWKLVMVGDASMAPGEMLSVGPWGSSWQRPDGGPMRGLDWLVALAERFDRSIWLDPDPPSYWVGGTVEIIGQVFEMYTLTLDGLTEAVTHLSKDAQGKRPKRIIGNPRNAL